MPVPISNPQLAIGKKIAWSFFDQYTTIKYIIPFEIDPSGLISRGVLSTGEFIELSPGSWMWHTDGGRAFWYFYDDPEAPTDYIFGGGDE